MRDFTDALGERLTALAAATAPDAARIRERPAEPTMPVAGRFHAALRRRHWIPAAGLVGSATAATAAFLVATPFAETAVGLPVLTMKPVDRSAVLAQVKLPRERLDLRHARELRLPTGVAFAVPSIDGSRICLIASDAEAPTTFGSACGSMASVRASGLVLEAVGDRSTNARATSTITAMLPTGASTVRVESGGRTTAPLVLAGTTSFTLSGPGTLRYATKGGPVQQNFEGPFTRTTGFVLSCPDGPRTFATTPPLITRPGQAPVPDYDRACR